jgi:hypothetical protein
MKDTWSWRGWRCEWPSILGLAVVILSAKWPWGQDQPWQAEVARILAGLVVFRLGAVHGVLGERERRGKAVVSKT